MTRRIVALALAVLFLTAVPAGAASDWDPNDVDGPLDLRWIGASFSDNYLRLTVSFYDAFRPSALRGPYRGVRVQLAWFHGTEFMSGAFIRQRDGHIVFRYGDGGQLGGMGCIDKTARVRRPSPNVLTVAFPIIGATYRVRATSKWVNARETVKDRTGWLRLGRHDGIIRPCG